MLRSGLDSLMKAMFSREGKTVLMIRERMPGSPSWWSVLTAMGSDWARISTSGHTAATLLWSSAKELVFKKEKG